MTERRRYSSPVREDRARRTRARIVSAARDLFVEQGFGQTSVSSVASAAGVAADTVYSSFTSKAGLLKAVVDTTLAGDDEPVPFAQRPQVAAIEAAPTAAGALRVYAPWAADTAARIAPVVLALRTARGVPDVDRLLDQLDEQRLVGVSMLAATVCAKPGAAVPPADLRDHVFVLASVETYDLAVNRRRWTHQRYTAWLGDALVAAAVLDRS